jgi:hypothetical protein
VEVCHPHVPLLVTEWVVIVVYELSNMMQIVGDDLKIHETFSACLTLKNTLDESVSQETKVIFVQKNWVGPSIGGPPFAASGSVGIQFSQRKDVGRIQCERLAGEPQNQRQPIRMFAVRS